MLFFWISQGDIQCCVRLCFDERCVGAFAGLKCLQLCFFKLKLPLYLLLLFLLLFQAFLLPLAQENYVERFFLFELLFLQHLRSFLFEVVKECGVLAPHLDQLLEHELLLWVDSYLVLIYQLLQCHNPLLR